MDETPASETPQPRQPLTEERVAEAVRATEGNLARAAKALGVARPTLVVYIKRHGMRETVLKAARRVKNDKRVGTALSKFDKALQKGERWAVLRVLDTIGADHGLSRKANAGVSVRGDVHITNISAADYERLPMADRVRIALAEAGVITGGGGPLLAPDGTGPLCGGPGPLDRPLGLDLLPVGGGDDPAVRPLPEAAGDGRVDEGARKGPEAGAGGEVP